VKLREESVDIGEIDAGLRACIETELASVPGSRVVKRKGRLFFKGKNGFAFRASGYARLKPDGSSLLSTPTCRRRRNG